MVRGKAGSIGANGDDPGGAMAGGAVAGEGGVGLPTSVPAPATEHAPRPRRIGRAKLGPRRKPSLGRALIVEDDALLAMELEDALIEGGAEQVVVCDGVAAAMVE